MVTEKSNLAKLSINILIFTFFLRLPLVLTFTSLNTCYYSYFSNMFVCHIWELAVIWQWHTVLAKRKVTFHTWPGEYGYFLESAIWRLGSTSFQNIDIWFLVINALYCSIQAVLIILSHVFSNIEGIEGSYMCVEP